MLASVTALTLGRPVIAAEELSFQYGPLSRTIAIRDLTTFANEGTASDQLKGYFDLASLTEVEIAAFRRALQRPASIDPQLLSRMLYSHVGNDILTEFLGNLIRTESDLNGKLALRAALVMAAYDEQGLTVLNVLRHLPVNMEVDFRAALNLSQSIERVVDATQQAVDTLNELSSQEAATEPAVDFDQLPALDQQGNSGVQRQQWQLTSERQNPMTGDRDSRQLYVEVFWPQQWRGDRTSVIVLSHGLASKPENYQEWARHLASHGYLVALPQHPGSDTEQRQQFRRGLADQPFLVRDFVERPRDVHTVIDELEQRNAETFGDRLDLDHVGVIGHSYGGYTAFAVAGASLNFDFLADACNDRFSYVNTSLLLQCQALELPTDSYTFQDPRVGAIAVLNPVNSSVFGPEGLSQVQIPVMVLAGSHDPATPAVFEQFRTFPWIGSGDRYLGLIEGQAHVDFSEIDAGVTDAIRSIEGLTLASPTIVDTYARSMTLAFFEAYVAEDESDRRYLQASYSDYLSQNEQFDLHWISAESSPEVREAIATFSNGVPLNGWSP